jgi:CBS domain-containing protein
MLMQQHDVDQLPVVDGERPIGMVDREQVGAGVLVSPGLGF